MYQTTVLGQEHMWCCSKCVPEIMPGSLTKLVVNEGKVICPKCNTDWTEHVDIEKFHGGNQ